MQNILHDYISSFGNILKKANMEKEEIVEVIEKGKIKRQGGDGKGEMEGREGTEMKWDGLGGRAKEKEERPRYEGGAQNKWEDGVVGREKVV